MASRVVVLLSRIDTASPSPPEFGLVGESAIVKINATGWEVSIQGSGVDIQRAGSYSSCPNPVSGQCITLSDVMNSPGVNGTLRPVAGGGREQQSVEYSTVVVISD